MPKIGAPVPAAPKPSVNAQDVAKWLHATMLRVCIPFKGEVVASWEQLAFDRRDRYLKVAQVMLDTPPPGFKRA